MRPTATPTRTQGQRINPIGDIGTHALSFDGGNNEVNLGHDTSLDLIGDFTIEMMVKFKNEKNTGLISKRTPSEVDGNWFFSQSGGLGNNDLQFAIYGSDGLYDNNVWVNVLDRYFNVWSHVVLSGIRNGEDDTLVSLYINGEFIGTREFTTYGIEANSQDVKLGFNGQSTSLRFNSLMRLSRIWNGKGLTSTEVSNIYYNKIVPRENLVAEYFRDINTDGAGTVLTDTSGNGNNGTITGATWIPLKDIERKAPGNDLSSLSFDGNDYINFGKILDLTNNFTIAGSFKIPSIQGPYGGNILTKRLGSDIQYQVRVSYNKLQFPTSGSATFESNKVLQYGEWYDFVVTFIDGEKKMYIDGVLDKSASGFISISSQDTELVSGVQQYGGTIASLTGKEKNIRAWNTILTPQQVYDLHYHNIVPYKDNPDILKLNIELNEGAGTTAYDSSGNGNNGTITGATWSADVPNQARQ